MKPAMTEAPNSPFIRILRGLGLLWVSLMLM